MSSQRLRFLGVHPEHRLSAFFDLPLMGSWDLSMRESICSDVHRITFGL